MKLKKQSDTIAFIVDVIIVIIVVAVGDCLAAVSRATVRRKPLVLWCTRSSAKLLACCCANMYVQAYMAWRMDDVELELSTICRKQDIRGAVAHDIGRHMHTTNTQMHTLYGAYIVHRTHMCECCVALNCYCFE